MSLKSNIVEEFFEVLEKSKAKNGCIMLPGHIQYWHPRQNLGAKDINIDEPIHFAGPRPDAQIDSAATNHAT